MGRNHDDLGRFQSGVLLPFARRVFLLAAGLAFLLMVGALGLAGYYQLAASQTPPLTPPPDPTIESTELLAALNSAAPIVLDVKTLTETDRGRDGILIAEIKSRETNNKIVSARNVETPDSALFRYSLPESTETSVRIFTIRIFATQAFWDSFSVDRNTAQSNRQYEIAFEYTDEREQSGQTTFKFYIPFKVAATSTRGQEIKPEPSDTPDEAEKVAQIIAELVDPDMTTLYFDTYLEILERVNDCATETRSFALVLQDQVATNAEYFSDEYAGVMIDRVCTQWISANDAANRKRQEFLAQQRRTRAQRAQMISSSMMSLIVAGGAFVMFFILIFPLSHLAMEDHLRAIREKQ